MKTRLKSGQLASRSGSIRLGTDSEKRLEGGSGMQLLEKNHPPVITKAPGLQHFPVLPLTLELEFQDGFRLPPFAGSMFRGVLGWGLREVCADELYHRLFETTSQVQGHKDAARPFLLRPPLHQRNLRKGDRLRLELTLLGCATDYPGEFLEALGRAGIRGLGSTQARFEIVKVQVQEGMANWICYDRSSPASTYLPIGSPLGAFVESNPEPASEIQVQFVTPTLLVHLNEPTHRPEFHMLLRAIARRLDSLLSHHAGQKLSFDFPEQIQASRSIQLADSALEWADWERTSNRQKARHRMGGIVGQALYTGEFRPEWIQMLQYATLVHVGKATTFGMGSIFCEIGATA